MRFLTSILGLFTGASGGWILYLAIGAVVFGAGSYAGEYGRGLIDAPKLSASQAATVEANAALQVEKQNLVQANANIATLQASLAADNSDVARWQAAAQMASAQATAAQQAADKATAMGEQRIAALLNTKAAGNVCTAALDLIHGVAP